MVLEARTLRMNCFTVAPSRQSTHLLFNALLLVIELVVHTGAHIAAFDSFSLVLILSLRLSGTASHVTAPAHLISVQASKRMAE